MISSNGGVPGRLREASESSGVDPSSICLLYSKIFSNESPALGLEREGTNDVDNGVAPETEEVDEETVALTEVPVGEDPVVVAPPVSGSPNFVVAGFFWRARFD